MQDLFGRTEEKQAPAPEPAGLVSVLVPFPVDKTYSYGVPAGMELAPGDYVSVPLGNREVPGVVWGLETDPVPPKKLKFVVVRHELSPMSQEQRDFIDWVAQYTMSAKGAVLKMALSVPAALNPPKATAKAYKLSALAQKALSPQKLLAGRGLGEGATLANKPTPEMTDRARDLRSGQTDAEQTLWLLLRDRRFEGYKFKRQHPIPPYIADFICLEKNLIIELDGGQHQEQQAYDEKRKAFLEAQGFTVLRFWNNEFLQNQEGVLEVVAKHLEEAPSPNPLPGGERAFMAPSPSPPRGEGRGEGAILRNLSPSKRKVLQMLSDNRPHRAGDLGVSSSVLKGLMASGLIEQMELFSSAPCLHPNPAGERAILSPSQKDAAEHLCQQVEYGGYHASLIDGVTGAGKTEIYFEAVAEALKQNRQVLILLPEIALSNAFLDRFRQRFGCAPALWHSSLTPAQRRTTWRGVAEGHSKVVVGARSALFLPYQNLGLMIVDEEHDPAYKQEDGVIYNARDMAVVRAHLSKIPIVLVSATPSLETMVNAWSGRYDHLHIPDRHGGATMPDMHLIDLRLDKPERQHFIAPSLRAAMEETLARGEQVLLFLNRRGYAPLTLCRTCGQRMECPRCTAWLVEHRSTARLECHHCGYFMPFPKDCPSCNDTDSLAACGPGVERIHDEVLEYFPDARTLVLASDTADSHDALKAILDDIREQRIDIVIGTQIIAKGHHFPGLTLVGVIDADLGLGGGDLRAAERTYQLLHQVAGRAGREELKGQVYLQTWIPENRVMQALSGHGRDSFLDVEAQERERTNMPPYSRLAGIIVSGRDEAQVDGIARALGVSAPQGEGIRTLGPAPAPMARLRGNYRKRLLVQADKTINLQKTIDGWMKTVKVPSTVRVQIDIDPQSFL